MAEEPVATPSAPMQDRSRASAARVVRLRASLAMFVQNFEELITFVDYFCSPLVASSYSPVNQRWLWYEGMAEIDRLLHNFVASAKSLIDHSGVLYRALYEPSGSIEDYPFQIAARFTNDPLVQFVIKLRVMAQHYRIPRVTNHTSVSGIAEGGAAKHVVRELRLITADLKEFDGWNAPSRRYLDAAGDHINIRSVAVDYNLAVLAFYEWFAARQREVHGRSPELLQLIALHGASGMNRPELAELEKGIAVLELIPPSKRTVTEALKAFSPVLSILDHRRLLLCSHDGRAWIEVALSAAARRFTLPDQLVARIRSLI